MNELFFTDAGKGVALYIKSSVPHISIQKGVRGVYFGKILSIVLMTQNHTFLPKSYGGINGGQYE